MANARAPGQKLLGFWSDQDFLDAIDRARGEVNRSQFVRDCVERGLADAGILVPRSVVKAPDRAGKGRPRKYLAPGEASQPTLLSNDGTPVSSRVAAAARLGASIALAKIRKERKS